MSIYVGESFYQPDQVFKGTQEVREIYKGTNLIWKKVSLKNGLISCWELDDSTLTIIAEDVHGVVDIDTQVSGVNKRQSGKIGYCYTLTGEDSPYTTNTAQLQSLSSANFSMSIWVNPSSNGVGHGDSWLFRLRGTNNGLVGFRLRDDGTYYPKLSFYMRAENNIAFESDGSGAAANNWHLLTATVSQVAGSGFNINFYINGKLRDSGFLNCFSSTPYPYVFLVMGGLDRVSDTFIGGIDQMAFWGRVLDPYEVQYLYNPRATQYAYTPGGQLSAFPDGYGIPYSRWKN